MCSHPPCKTTTSAVCTSHMYLSFFACRGIPVCLLPYHLRAAQCPGKKGSPWYSTNIVLSLFPFFSVLLTRGHNWCQPEAPAGSRAAPEDNCHREIRHSYEAGRLAPGGTVLQDLSSARLTWRGAEQVLGVPLQAGNRFCETYCDLSGLLGESKTQSPSADVVEEILALAC